MTHPLTLDSRTRIARALHGELIDRAGIGEFSFDQHLVREALGMDAEAAVPLAARQAVLQRLGHDLITVPIPGEDGDLETALFTLNYWRNQSKLFVFACIPGPLNDLIKIWKPAKASAISQWGQAEQLVADALLERYDLIQQIAQAGAEGLIIREELAHGSRAVLPLPILQQIYFPYLTVLVNQAQTAGLPVMLSSPGDMTTMIPDLVATGLNGLHGLEPTLGLTPATLVQSSQGLLCPWGGFDPAWLALSTHAEPDMQAFEVARLVQTWGRKLGDAPAIFGFWNGVPATLPVQALEGLYKAVKCVP